MSKPKKTGKALAIRRTGNVVQLRIRPTDVRVLEAADRADFARCRAQWLELLRRDAMLRPSTIVVLTEIANRAAWDRDGAWPSVSRLAADLGLSEPTVKRAVAQAIARGWLTRERRGFSLTNRYHLAVSARIAEEVYQAHDVRLGSHEARRAKATDAVSEITGDPSVRSSMIPHSDHRRSLSEITGDPVTSTRNPNIEIAPTNPKKTLTGPAGLGVDLFRLLGDGDLGVGEQIAARLGPSQASRLAEHVHDVGEVAASEAIRAAIDRANLTKPSAPAAPAAVIELADVRTPKPSPRSRRAQPQPDARQIDLFA